MPRIPRYLVCLFSLFVITVLVAKPLPARADGGPIVRYDLWTYMKEGQQTAVITIQDKDTAKVDLFISLLDKTGESHDVVFFLPLGTSAANFYVVEQELATFNKMTTSSLDRLIRQNEWKKEEALHALFTGTLLSNGIWLIPFWAPILLTGCAGAPAEPEATFQTDSSQVSIFSLKEDTDLEALIDTAGLDISVKETLSRLRGQQIAVVNMQTQPQTSAGSGESGGFSSELGIHLCWVTSLVVGESGATYAYPLGTGASWYHPIELTRVYVVAPAGIDFCVSYPALGSRVSSFGSTPFHSTIADYYQVPAYAIDNARGDFGRVWRATYTQSNAAEDIIIAVGEQTGLSRLVSTIEQNVFPLASIFALIVGLALWMLAWHFLMPRLLGKQSRQDSRLQWYFGLIYPAINAALVIIPGAILYFIFAFGLAIPAFPLIPDGVLRWGVHVQKIEHRLSGAAVGGAGNRQYGPGGKLRRQPTRLRLIVGEEIPLRRFRGHR